MFVFRQKESAKPGGIALYFCIKMSVPLFYRLITMNAEFSQLFLLGDFILLLFDLLLLYLFDFIKFEKYYQENLPICCCNHTEHNYDR